MATGNDAEPEKGFRFKGSRRRVLGFIFIVGGIFSFIGEPGSEAVILAVLGVALVAWGYYLRSKKIVKENFTHKAEREAAEREAEKQKNASIENIEIDTNIPSPAQPLLETETNEQSQSSLNVTEESASTFTSGQEFEISNLMQSNSVTHNELPRGKKVLWDRDLVVKGDLGRQAIYVMRKHERAGRRFARQYLDYDWVEMYARLEPEPTNSYDSSAVKVCVDDTAVGYLSYGAQEVANYDLARNRKKCFLKLLFKAYSIDDYKYWFFASPTDMEEWKSYLSNGNTIGVKANLRHSNEYQEALQALDNKDPNSTGTVCTIKVDKQPSGKYKDGPRLTVYDPDGTVLGVIDARYQEKDPRFFAAVLSGHTQCVVKVFENYFKNKNGEGWSLYGAAYIPGVN